MERACGQRVVRGSGVGEVLRRRHLADGEGTGAVRVAEVLGDLGGDTVVLQRG